MFDSILGYYMNPLASGIAKFNTLLGEKMNVPYLSFFSQEASSFKCPILSFKVCELDGYELERLSHWIDHSRANGNRFAFYFHHFSDSQFEWKVVKNADWIFCSNQEIYQIVQAHNPNCFSLCCPSTLVDERDFPQSSLTVLTFGMAHKIRARRYLKLKELLEDTGLDYSIYMSTAMHDSANFSEALKVVSEEMREIFGDSIYAMGYLSDVAIYNYLRKCDYLAAFFENGLRANNTTVNAALQNGSAVITNLDSFSPKCIQHEHNVIDIDQCHSLKYSQDFLEKLKKNARSVGTNDLGWKTLIDRIEHIGLD